jgi:hypothetical protein
MNKEQLENFCQYERVMAPEKTHVAQWALEQIERLTTINKQICAKGNSYLIQNARLEEENAAEKNQTRIALADRNDIARKLEAAKAERDALKADARWNKALRDSVDKLLEGKYQPDSSVRHSLAMMRFDAAIKGEIG